MNIDFSLLAIKKKTYGGANGSKLSVIYNDKYICLSFLLMRLRTLIYHMRIVAFWNI